MELVDNNGDSVEMSELNMNGREDKEELEVKPRLQGVMRPEVAALLDIKTHFKTFDQDGT